MKLDEVRSRLSQSPVDPTIVRPWVDDLTEVRTILQLFEDRRPIRAGSIASTGGTPGSFTQLVVRLGAVSERVASRSAWESPAHASAVRAMGTGFLAVAAGCQEGTVFTSPAFDRLREAESALEAVVRSFDRLG